MKRPQDFVTPRLGFLAVALVAVGLVFVAIALTHALSLQPCPLCIFQRLLYLLLGGFALTAALYEPARMGAGVMALLASAGGAATAAYQSWMQAFPARFVECNIGVPTTPIEQVVDWLGRLWPWMFYAWGECTSREWVLFGLSMANWSLVAFLALTVAVAFLLRLHRSRTA